MVPQGGLRVTAGGPTELEALRFAQGERRLRLDIDSPITEWNEEAGVRFRLIAGRLGIGTETFTGPVLEMLRVDQTDPDGWPAGLDADAIFLISGDSLQMLLTRSTGGEGEDTGYAWTRTASLERTWDRAEVQRMELQPYQEARREIPMRWRFRIPAAGIEGEVQAAGFDAILGPERGGRRVVEIRYTVEGVVNLEGKQRPVVGMIRHTQL